MRDAYGRDEGGQGDCNHAMDNYFRRKVLNDDGTDILARCFLPGCLRGAGLGR